MTTVGLYLGGNIDVASWAEAHKAGEVPDCWPYGLDRIGPRVGDLRATHPPTAVGTHLLRASRRLGRGYDWVGRPRPQGVDVVVSWDERVGVPVSHIAHVPVLTGTIWLTEPDRGRHWTDAAVRRSLQRCATVWVLSAAQLPVLRSRWGVKEARLRHVLFGVDKGFWRCEGEPEPFRLLVVGNDRHRDHATALQAARIAQATVPELRVHLVTTQGVAVPVGLGRRSEYLSHRELRCEYEAAQVCAIALRPNLHCSGITAALEAMACARPVVVTDTPGMRDYVDDGVTGVLVPHGDVDAMAKAACSLMQDPDRAREIGLNGRRRVEEMFNTDEMAAQIAALVDEAV